MRLSKEERIIKLETQVEGLSANLILQAKEYERRLVELQQNHRWTAVLAAVAGGVVTGLIVKLLG